MDAVGTLNRTGRVAFFTHESRRDVPPAIEKWQLHETSVLTNLTTPVRLVPLATVRGSSRAWVVWRLLSGNNREIGRGVGAHATLESARRAAELAVASADGAEALLAFDRKSAHAWCLQFDATPLIIAPAWHRSRRTNRLNLEIVRATLGRADLNGAVTALDGHGRRGVST